MRVYVPSKYRTSLAKLQRFITYYQGKKIVLWDVEVLTFSKQSAHICRWGCQPYTLTDLYIPGKIPVLISLRGWVDSTAIVRVEGLGNSKKQQSSELIGNRTRDLPASTIVSRRTTLSRDQRILTWWPSSHDTFYKKLHILWTLYNFRKFLAHNISRS
jgi:hypothetical protein